MPKSGTLKQAVRKQFENDIAPVEAMSGLKAKLLWKKLLGSSKDARVQRFAVILDIQEDGDRCQC
jgi:hypothetical protein